MGPTEFAAQWARPSLLPAPSRNVRQAATVGRRVEEHADKQAFLEPIRTSAAGLAKDGYLLAEDVGGIVAASAARWDELMRLESPLPGSESST